MTEQPMIDHFAMLECSRTKAAVLSVDLLSRILIVQTDHKDCNSSRELFTNGPISGGNGELVRELKTQNFVIMFNTSG